MSKKILFIIDEVELKYFEFNDLVTIKTDAKVDEIIVPIVDDKVKKHTEKVVNDLNKIVEEVKENINTKEVLIGKNH